MFLPLIFLFHCYPYSCRYSFDGAAIALQRRWRGIRTRRKIPALRERIISDQNAASFFMNELQLGILAVFRDLQVRREFFCSAMI